ncbi:MAG: carboxypeptidase-like regulatory domain-containing protein [Gemmatimonadota bacterium]|nr:carboxypeptidase-like regulatory domain-containing protein [Gemmatimonadota bacterium]
MTGVARLACSVLALAGTVPGPAVLAAQEVRSADPVVLEGEVVDLSNNVPVEGAIVSLPGLGLTAVTDSLGYYRLDEVPAAFHTVRVFRIGYEALEAVVPINGAEVVVLHLTPGAIPLEGIEVEVVGLSELDWRPVGTSRQAFIGPGEIEDLRDTFQSLDHILRVRRLPQVRYIPPVQPGGIPGDDTSNGCLRLVTQSGRRVCAMVVMDGVPIDPATAGWMYQTSSHDIYSLRFLGGVEGFHRYGDRGSFGVIEIVTHNR